MRDKSNDFIRGNDDGFSFYFYGYIMSRRDIEYFYLFIYQLFFDKVKLLCFTTVALS